MRIMSRSVMGIAAAVVVATLAGCGSILSAASASGRVPDGRGMVVSVQTTIPDNPATPQIETACKITLQPADSDKRYETDERRNYSLCAAAGQAGSEYVMRRDNLTIIYTFLGTVDSVTMTRGSSECTVVLTGDPAAEYLSTSMPNAVCVTLKRGSQIEHKTHTITD